MAREPDIPTATAGSRLADRQLLLAAKGGDRDAASQLVDETYQMVYASLFRLTGGNADTTADLTQETYRRAWQSLHTFKGRSRVSTWLFRIAYTTFLNHVRSPRRLEPLEAEVADALPADSPSQEESLEALVAGQRARRAVLGLNDELRYTVTARYWGELSVRDIAEEQGLTPAAIRKRLNKAFRLLAIALEENAS